MSMAVCPFVRLRPDKAREIAGPCMLCRVHLCVREARMSYLGFCLAHLGCSSHSPLEGHELYFPD